METASSIFTKIINREIPADIVFEDERTIAFLTIEPVHYGHTLVVPKVPFRNLLDGDDNVLMAMIIVAKNVAKAIIAANLGTGVNLVMNNEAAAGQEVFHAHMHVIPRKPEDERVTYQHIPYDQSTSGAVATQLRSLLE